MDYEKLGKEIANLSPTIRFVEIYHDGEKFTSKRDDLEELLTPKEVEMSIKDALSRWKTRIQLSDKLGEPVYAMAEYKKVKRITIAFDTDGLIMISMDSKGYHEVIIKEIIEIKTKFE